VDSGRHRQQAQCVCQIDFSSEWKSKSQRRAVEKRDKSQTVRPPRRCQIDDIGLSSSNGSSGIYSEERRLKAEAFRAEKELFSLIDVCEKSGFAEDGELFEQKSSRRATRSVDKLETCGVSIKQELSN
jgi:hypothetical protein